MNQNNFINIDVGEIKKFITHLDEKLNNKIDEGN
jgi:hypothetical protein